MPSWILVPSNNLCRTQTTMPLQGQLSIVTLLQQSFLCISPVSKSLKTKKKWRIGREVHRVSSFLYVSAPVNHDDCCILQASHSYFPDWPLLLHGGYFHCPQLPELATRSQRHHPVTPRTNITTTFEHHHWHRCRQYPKSLRPSHVSGIHQLSLVPQPRAQSHVRAHGHTFATMGPQIPPDSSTKIRTPSPCPYTRVLLPRRAQVLHLRVCRGATCPSSPLRVPVLRRTRRLCLSQQPHRRIFHPRNRRTLHPLVYCPHSNAAHLS